MRELKNNNPVDKKLSICMLGEFDKNLIFNRTFIEGLEKKGCKIIIHNAAEQKFSGITKIGKILFILSARKKEADIYYVPFPVRNYGLVAKIVSILTKKPLVIDFLVSDYANRKFEHKSYENSIFGTLKRKLDFLNDYLTFNLADLALVDTKENGQWFSELFNTDNNKWFVKNFGESTELFKPTKLPKTKEFKIIYFLGYLPTHNVPYVLEAAKILEKDKEIKFSFMGNGPEKNSSIKMAKKLHLNNVEFLDHVSYNKLPTIIQKSHVILGGPFIRGEKADRVITSKTFTGLASGRPVIIGKTPCTSRFFQNHENAVVFVDLKNPGDFAAKVKALKANRSKTEKIGENAYRFFIENFTPELIGTKLKQRLLKLVQ